MDEGKEKSGSCEKQGREQGKEKGSRVGKQGKEGKQTKEGTAHDRKRDEREANVRPSSQEETKRDKPEPKDTRNKKKHTTTTTTTSTKYTVTYPRRETPKALKGHDEGYINLGNQEFRRQDNIKNGCGEETKHSSMKTPDRIHSSNSKGNKTRRQALSNHQDSQANPYTKNRENKDKSFEKTVHRENHNTTNTKTCTPNNTTINESRTDDSENNSDINTSLYSGRKQEERILSKKTSDRKSSHKEGRHSKNRHQGSSMLAGAPRLRQVLSLTPDRHKGRIWAPLNLSLDISKDNIKYNKGESAKSMNQVSTEKTRETQENNDPRERGRVMCKPGRSKFQREWEEARLTMLLGTQFKSSLDNNQDKQEGKDNEDSNDTPGLRNDHQLTHKSIVTPVSWDASGHTSEKSHTSPHSPNIQHTTHTTPDTNKSETPKRDHHNSTRPKLSTFIRKIYKVESGLSFARERKDKTPYLDRSFGTPYLGGPIFNTSGSSFSSSRTPTDPILERSCEDPFGSQGTELHINTTIHSITNSQDQDSAKRTSESEPNIQQFDIDHIQKYPLSVQCASETPRSPLSVVQESEQLKPNGRTWMTNDNYANLVTDPHQYVTHLVSNENNTPGAVCFDPRYSQWHMHNTLPAQHQHVCQDESVAQGTSSHFNTIALHPDNTSKVTHTPAALPGMKHQGSHMDNPLLPPHTQLTSNDTHDSHHLIGTHYSTNSDQSQGITEATTIFHPHNEMLTYLNSTSDLAPAQASHHPSGMPTHHFTVQDNDANQDLEVIVPQANNTPTYKHNNEFCHYSEASAPHSSSQYSTSALTQDRMEWQHESEGSGNSLMHYNRYSTLDEMRLAAADARDHHHHHHHHLLREDARGSFQNGTGCFLTPR